MPGHHHTIYQQNTAIFAAPDAVFDAIGWYQQICLVGPCGGKKTYVSVYRYDQDTDSFVKASPISKVVPSTAWTPGSQTVSTATAVTITALVPLPPKRGCGEVFTQWQVYPSTGTTKFGPTIAVPAGDSPVAIAYYNQVCGAPIGPPF